MGALVGYAFQQGNSESLCLSAFNLVDKDIQAKGFSLLHQMSPSNSRWLKEVPSATPDSARHGASVLTALEETKQDKITLQRLRKLNFH